MIIVCSRCTTRLQLQDTKVPSRPFTIRCPKCQNIINGQPVSAVDDPSSPANQGAFAVGNAPSLEHPRLKQAAPAPAFKVESDAKEDVQAYGNSSAADPEDLSKLLLNLLQRASLTGQEKQRGAQRLSWEKRLALVCVTPQHREMVARSLAESNYQVFVAEDTTQAIERMRDDRMDVIILDPNFDPVEQGLAFITSQINSLRPSERRRLFYVQLNEGARTLDSHAAFVNNVNLVVNPADLENLPQVLERALRDFNDLYRDFNNALNIAAL